MADAEGSILGTTIRQARLKLGLTGAQLREQTGIDPTSLSMWERGVRTPPLKKLRPLAKALRLDAVELAALALGCRRKSRS